MEGKNLCAARRQSVIDPARIVEDAVASHGGHVKDGLPKGSQQVAVSVAGLGYQNCSVKFIIAPQASIDFAFSNDKDDALPTGIACVAELALDYKHSVPRRFIEQKKIPGYDYHHGVRGGHLGR